jgi:hypothetical protein
MGSQELPAEAGGDSPRVHPHFSKERNALPNVSNTDVIGAFLTGTTCESLVHKLGCKSPRTTKELLDIMMNHAQVRRWSG